MGVTPSGTGLLTLPLLVLRGSGCIFVMLQSESVKILHIWLCVNVFDPFLITLFLFAVFEKYFYTLMFLMIKQVSILYKDNTGKYKMQFLNVDLIKSIQT